MDHSANNHPLPSSQWQDDDGKSGHSGHSDLPPTRSSNEPPEPVHSRSRSTAHAQSPKRLSVFSSGRSRSNTTTSSSPRPSPGSSMTSTDGSSSIPSQDERTGSVMGFRADKQKEKPSRRLLSRGSRMLRRQSSKINVIAALEEHDEMDREKLKPEKVDMFTRHRRHQHHEQFKRLISDPFDFHHLTHTSAAQFQSLHQTRQNDLVTEFSAIRASQRAQTDLKGIRADDIHFRNFSSEELTTYGTATTVDGMSRSPPGSPVSPSRSNTHARRESRVMENFSRPASRYYRPSPTTPCPPSPSVIPEQPPSPESAEPAPRAIDEVLGLASTTCPEYTQSNADTDPTNLDGETLRSVSVSSHYDLEDVPEEVEEAIRYWDDPESGLGYPRSCSASQVSPLRLPVRTSSRANRKRRLSIIVAEELSRKFSEALGSPTLPQNRMSRNPLAANPAEPILSVHKSSYEDLYDSWDADIDYCYEHAAESTSNFDWSRTSLDESQRPQIDVACSDGPWLAPPTRQLHPSPLSTSTIPTPDLDPSSARSAPSHSLVTPSTAEYEEEVSHGAGAYFDSVSSSMVSTLGKQITQDTLYEDYLAADAESDQHFPFQGIAERPVSARSSFSPISKYNSQESLMLSRAASSVRKHRSSASILSVPELVHSHSSSRELMAADLCQASPAQSAPNLLLTSHHRQTKSLAGSSASLDSTPSSTPAPSHDRAKSTSYTEPPPLSARPPIPPKNPSRRMGRTSYTLFPTAH